MVKKALMVSAAAPTYADVFFHAPRPDRAPVDPGSGYGIAADG
jgi:hypothetical protein